MSNGIDTSDHLRNRSKSSGIENGYKFYMYFLLLFIAFLSLSLNIDCTMPKLTFMYKNIVAVHITSTGGGFQAIMLMVKLSGITNLFFFSSDNETCC